MKKHILILSSVLLASCLSNGNSGADNSMPSNRGGSAKHSGACQLIQGDAPGAGRKVVYRCNGNQILNSSVARSILGGMPVSFGRGQGNASGYRTTRQAANRVSLGDEGACERAFVNALAKFKATAQKGGHRNISDLHSFYNRIPQSGGIYDCEVGTFHGRVVFRARLH